MYQFVSGVIHYQWLEHEVSDLSVKDTVVVDFPHSNPGIAEIEKK